MGEMIKKYSLHIAWLQSVVATFGSLYYSEVMKLTPCVLCWYQRILMYPLVIILAVALIYRDKKVYLYVLPMAVTGWLIALYHNLLYYNILPEAAAPCAAGISCTTRYVAFFGYVTIPLQSFIAFSVIIACMLVFKKYNQNS